MRKGSGIWRATEQTVGTDKLQRFSAFTNAGGVGVGSNVRHEFELIPSVEFPWDARRLTKIVERAAVGAIGHFYFAPGCKAEDHRRLTVCGDHRV
jgi:hypothetical protein